MSVQTLYTAATGMVAREGFKSVRGIFVRAIIPLREVAGNGHVFCNGCFPFGRQAFEFAYIGGHLHIVIVAVAAFHHFHIPALFEIVLITEDGRTLLFGVQLHGDPLVPAGDEADGM